MKKVTEDQFQNEVRFKVPADILIDVLAILIREELGYEIIQVQEMRKTALMAVQIDSSLPRQIKAKENIQSLIAIYEDYRYNEPEETDWREN